jgi:hypothetical protein
MSKDGVELSVIQWEGTINWYRLMNLAVEIRMWWSLVLSNGKGPKLVQANESCCRSKLGIEICAIQ